MSRFEEPTFGTKQPQDPFDPTMFSQPQLDPYRFVVVHCDSKADARRQQLDRTKRKGFIAGLDKIAGIEGLGVIQEGLGAIVKATGVGGSDAERIINGGVEGIFSTVLGSQATNVLTGAMEKINPGAVNKGVSSAKIILNKVKNKDFNWRDVPQHVADFKNLWTIGKQVVNPFLTGGSDTTGPKVACSASPYAMDLVALGVKHKFLFVVEFKFYAEYQGLVDMEPSFIVKTADRPSVTYEYEDVNLYNFRTKVIKKATFSPVGMTFHDDEQNRAVAFYNSVMRIMSPITNHPTPFQYENTGMEFNGTSNESTGTDSPTQGIPVHNHAASIGPLIGDRTSIIESINLYHVYLGGSRVNRYTFHKPRILNMSLDQLDMADGNATELKLEFAFDNIEIINNDDTALPMADRDRANGSMYPLGGNHSNQGDFGSKLVNEFIGPPMRQDGEFIGPPMKGTLGGPLSEEFAKGGSFIGGAIDKVKGGVSGVTNKIKGAFGK